MSRDNSIQTMSISNAIEYTLKMISLLWYVYIYFTLLIIIIVGVLVSIMECVYLPANFVSLVLFFCFYVSPGVIT